MVNIEYKSCISMRTGLLLQYSSSVHTVYSLYPFSKIEAFTGSDLIRLEKLFYFPVISTLAVSPAEVAKPLRIILLSSDCPFLCPSNLLFDDVLQQTTYVVLEMLILHEFYFTPNLEIFHAFEIITDHFIGISNVIVT